MGGDARLRVFPIRSARRWLLRSALLPALSIPVLGAAAAQNPATLLQPSGVAYDAAGNLFIADAGRNQVFEITLAGAIVSIAGTGVQGFTGDSGPATGAELNAPQGIAVAADAIYIADTGNQRIRVVRNGQIATLAGGKTGFAGDGGLASTAEFNRPTAVALDFGGDLLVCDSDNQRVRRISNGIVVTIAGDGIEGFAGDGGPAIAAELNEPSGIAAGPDGRMFIADSANQRIRVVTAEGNIATFAGTGVAGFTGDGGKATAAQLNRPHGLALDAHAELLIADQNNHRLRRVGVDGTIVTIAGDGVQGDAADGAPASSALDLPGAVAVSIFGWPLLSNHTLRALLDDGRLYEPAGLASRVTTLTQKASDAVYGTASSSLVASSSAGTPRGAVRILDGSMVAGQGNLAKGTAAIRLPTLTAGTHTLMAIYAGDGVHPSATTTSTVTVSPAPVIALAAGAVVSYGAPLPALTGTLMGVLPQDEGDVTAVFSATAPRLPSAGSYPISAVLSGSASGNYSLSMGPASGSLTVVPAASIVTMSPIANAYAGLPLKLSAQVTSMTEGVPAGSVEFFDGGALVASARVVNGFATAVYLAPMSGAHQLTASYSGEGNFASSTSATVLANVMPVPDFGVSVSGESQQVVVAGAAAKYALSVASRNDPFTGVVTLSASGLPAGASVSFSPPAVVPGAGPAAVMMTIVTAVSSAQSRTVGKNGSGILLGMLILPLLAGRRRTRRAAWICAMTAAGLLGLTGCGARIASEPALTVQNFVVTVKATSTDVAGNVVVHAVDITLGIE